MHLSYWLTATVASLAPIAMAFPSELDQYLAKHPISTVTRLSAASSATTQVSGVLQSNPALVHASRNRCPVNCGESGSNPSNWTVYHNVDRLAWCNKTMLLDFSVFNELADPGTHTRIRACTANDQGEAAAPSAASCSSISNGSKQNTTTTLQSASSGSTSSNTTSKLSKGLAQLEAYMTHMGSCDSITKFAFTESVYLGVYVGTEIQRQGLTTALLDQAVSALQDLSSAETALVQLCGTGPNSAYTFGLFASTQNLGDVQDAVQTWTNESCITSYPTTTLGDTVSLAVPITVHTASNSSNATLTSRSLQPRANCSTIQVVSGDSCSSLAAECGITAAEFTEYNPSSTLCSTLTAGEHVCCSSGTLPDFAPQPYANGTCATYLVVSGDTCSALAATYSLSEDDIESYNTDTWGWMGCSDLQVGNNICLSTGSPPMPAPIANAVCGPQVPGTVTVPSGTNLSTLNECPLNACCDIWGQCGTTDEFCTITESPTGAPGTAAAGTNGCISNCGTDIVEGDGPSQFRKIAYFEGFDQTRPCLSNPVTSLYGTDYTHIVLAFAGITPDFQINVSTISTQLNEFMELDGSFKKIVSIGGWDFSTSPSTYNIFREAVTEANMDAFISSIITFVQEYDLDGIDFDWEYPGEPDIPGIPAGSVADGTNYFLFLDALKYELDIQVPGTTISIAAPASYWYLQNFPIQAISDTVDWIVFMTYDLHGQWDYGNANAQPGCPAGNCLRSDVNLTETINSLSMITKAGVPSSQVVVGVTSYGRSFQMTTAGCYSEMCTYTGPASGAYPGSCTNTAGYLANAEIAYANATGSNVFQTTDSESYVDILVWDDTQWVSWMSDSNKAVRTLLYQDLNFGGTTDWAVDLQGTADTITGQCKSLDQTDTGFPTCVPLNPDTGCIAGTAGDVSSECEVLCEFSCQYDYCPEPFCTCTQNGTLLEQPTKATGSFCPVSTLDSSYQPLCSFDCGLGYCPDAYCVTSSDEDMCINDPYTGAIFVEELNSDSSCAELIGYQTMQTYYWNDVDTTTALTNYLNSYTDDGDFIAEFAAQLQMENGFSDCGSISDTCEIPDCTLSTAGTGWKYCVLVSIGNLNKLLAKIHDAVQNMPANFSTRADTIYSTFTWPPATDESLLLTELMTGISTGISVLSTLTGDDVVAAGGAFISGMISEGMAAAQSSATEANNLSIAASKWAEGFNNQMDKIWNYSIANGNVSMVSLFENGAFLREETMPLISTNTSNLVTTTEISTDLNYVWDAAIVNTLWNQSSVFLYCYPMSEDDFNSNSGKYPTDLQAWISQDSGYGCYLQGISDYNVIYTYGLPPGYDQLGGYRFTAIDVIQSSYASFVQGGFNYVPPIDSTVQSVLSLSTDAVTSTSIYTMAGTFTLPICDPSGSWSKDDFYTNMNYTGYGYTASVCGCQDYADKNGKTFSEFIGIGDGCSCGGGAGCCVTTGTGVDECP